VYGSFVRQLRRLDLIRNKHIPQKYLRGDYRQRLALLQGLMDTDGTVSKSGQCEFCGCSERLVGDVRELISTLGIKSTIKKDLAKLRGRAVGYRWRIRFYADNSTPVFRLKRKLARQKPAGKRDDDRFLFNGAKRWKSNARCETLTIVDVAPVESVPMRCIQVDSPSSMYLCGETMIPTHNSTFCAGVALYTLYADGEDGAECYCAACDREQAGLLHGIASGMVTRNASLNGVSRIIPSTKRITYKDSYFRALPADAHSSHGFNPHLIVADEVHAWKQRDLWDVLLTGTVSRAQPIVMAITGSCTNMPRAFVTARSTTRRFCRSYTAPTLVTTGATRKYGSEPTRTTVFQSIRITCGRNVSGRRKHQPMKIHFEDYILTNGRVRKRGGFSPNGGGDVTLRQSSLTPKNARMAESTCRPRPT
jgi:hypothetical protein